MKRIGYAMLLALMGVAVGQAAPKVIGEWPEEIAALACTDGENIYVIKPGDTAPRPVAQGSEPALSPDGGQVAYTRADYDAPEGEPERSVRIKALGGGAELTPFAQKLCFSPMWSPDGRFVAANVFTGPADAKNWTVWTYEVQPGKQRYASKAVPGELGTYLCSWFTPTALLAQDTSVLYELGADGSMIGKLDLMPITDGLAVGSDTRYVLTADRRYLYFAAAESVEDGAPSYIYKRAVKAGPPIKVCEGTEFQLLAPGVLLVGVTHNDSPQIVIHREEDKTTQPLVEFAWSPSAALAK